MSKELQQYTVYILFHRQITLRVPVILSCVNNYKLTPWLIHLL